MDTQATKTNTDDSPTKDKIFDPSIDMLINDFDDERTLEEEEALAAEEDPSEELSSLEKEGNMPLEELLALYNYTGGNKEASQGDEDLDEDLDDDETMEISETEPTPAEKPSNLSAIYEPMAENESEDLKITESVSKLSDDEEDLANYSSDEEMKKLKKTIMVGSDYQAQVPKGLTTYGDVSPYENDELMWNPNNITNKELEEYLKAAQEITKTTSKKEKDRLLNGAHLRDNEQALLVLQQGGYKTEDALRRLRIMVQTESPEKPKDTEWSETESKNFEEGIKVHGKNFLAIQKEFVKTRTVSEIIQFYYMWKKTEHHDIFAHKNKLEKKKYTLNPGMTDFMDRFLEEQKNKKNMSANEKPEKALPNT